MSPRGLVNELCVSLALVVVFAALGAPLWATLAQVHDPGAVASVFFMTVATCWAILVPSKVWTERRGDAWSRRVVLLVLGAGLGMLALWLDGFGMPFTGLPRPSSDAGLIALLPAPVMTEAGYLTLYGAALFALRWWRMTDRRRSQRFSVAPLLAAAFWAMVLMMLLQPQPWPRATHPVVVLVLSSAILQLVSPWQQPPPPQAKRLRLKSA